jgi:gamma-glutamyl phosphate reductase
MLNYENMPHAMFLRNVRENLLKAINGIASPRSKGQDLVDAKVASPNVSNSYFDFVVERTALREFLKAELVKVEAELERMGVEIRGKEEA